jgi:PAS domain S-box-containing protein
MMAERRLPWVLVVDDNEANRYAIARMLRGAGFETSEAASGRQAIEAARRGPDVVVLDVNLPDMNGFDVVRELRANDATAVVPILHLSASYMKDEDRVFGLDNGANAYLTHPVEPAVFVATVRSLVRLRRLEEAQASAASEWQATFDAIGDVVCVVDGGGAITRANRAALMAFGKPAIDVLGKQWLVLMCQAFAGIDESSLAEMLGRGAPASQDIRAGDRWLCVTLDPLSTHSGFEGSSVCIVSDVTERRRAEEDRTAALSIAEAARAAAVDANNAKGEFLATMSHEIRTPINAILGYAQLLDMGIVGSVSDEQRTQLDRLRRSAAHLLRLVNEVFDLATVDAGQMRLDRDQYPVDEAIEDALAIGRPVALARGITVELPREERRLLYVGDAGRVRQILVNLISNAVKFSQPGDRMSLESELAVPPSATSLDIGGDRRFVAIRVHDSGPGIQAEQLKEIFEPFVQGDSGMTRAYGGSGLGLAISRRLARLMGGDVSVESETGRGSSFSLWLPAAADQTLVATAEQPTQRRASAAFDPKMFAELGRLLTNEALAIGHAMATALRTREGGPFTGSISDSQLVDHIPAYIADLGLTLVIVSEVGAEASTLLHDGNAIRNEIAERHGAQRRRLGWTARDIESEYDELLAQIEHVLRARSSVTEHQLDGAIELVSRLIAQSAAASVRGHREASAVED